MPKREKVIELDPTRRRPRRARLVTPRAAAVAPASMEPGDYVVQCVHGRLEHKGVEPAARLTFRIDDGDCRGVVVYGWFRLPSDGVAKPGSRYYKAAALALGREPTPDEDLDPRKIFGQKFFEVRVGYSARGPGNDFDDVYTQQKKSPRDFLRVVELLEKLEK